MVSAPNQEGSWNLRHWSRSRVPKVNVSFTCESPESNCLGDGYLPPDVKVRR